VKVKIDRPILEVLVTIFHEFEMARPWMGAAPIVWPARPCPPPRRLAWPCLVRARLLLHRRPELEIDQLVHFIIGSALKDQPDDRRRLRITSTTEVCNKPGDHWRET
jgi:hypothetical protein